MRDKKLDINLKTRPARSFCIHMILYLQSCCVAQQAKQQKKTHLPNNQQTTNYHILQTATAGQKEQVFKKQNLGGQANSPALLFLLNTTARRFMFLQLQRQLIARPGVSFFFLLRNNIAKVG
jgi:hypothetical protein